MPPINADVDSVRLLSKFNIARADGQLLPAPFNVVAKTASYTILPSDKCGTLFTNRGAAGAVTFTLPLPAAVPAGWFYYFIGLVAQDLIIAAAAADTLVTLNDAAADSIATSTGSAEIGACTKLISDGTQWIALGETVGVTYTVVTA